MADTIPDTTIGSNTWVDVYSSTSITVGTNINIINKGSNAMYLYEGTTQPDNDATDGVPLTGFSGNTHSAEMESGSNTVWAKTVKGSNKITVVDLS